MKMVPIRQADYVRLEIPGMDLMHLDGCRPDGGFTIIHGIISLQVEQCRRAG